MLNYQRVSPLNPPIGWIPTPSSWRGCGVKWRTSAPSVRQAARRAATDVVATFWWQRNCCDCLRIYLLETYRKCYSIGWLLGWLARWLAGWLASWLWLCLCLWLWLLLSSSSLLLLKASAKSLSALRNSFWP